MWLTPKYHWYGIMNNILKIWREKIIQNLPERQLLVRSNGYVKFFLISTSHQVIIIGTITAIIAWCIFTFFSYVWGYNPLRAPWKEVKKIELKYEGALDTVKTREEAALKLLDKQKKEFEKITQTIEEKHSIITKIASITDLKAGDQTEKFLSNRSIVMSPHYLDKYPRKSINQTLDSLVSWAEPKTYESLNLINEAQNELLLKNEDEILDLIEFKRAVIKSTGISVNDILSNSSDGFGGPLLVNENNINHIIPHNIQNFKLRIKEAETLANIVKSLPTAYPVSSIKRLTSPFGKRKDPFTNQYTEHQGIDFGTGGERESYIIAPSEGKIIFKGNNGGYGHSLKIDHGYGLITIYGHLKRNNDSIEVGDYVKKGDKIGIMGSTGRSTAPHLHYEVHFNGRAIDPNRFLKAGYYVQ